MPSVAFVEGDSGRTATNGSPAYAAAMAASSDAVVGDVPAVGRA